MRFIDEAIISVVGGRGGNGCSSFRREKFIAKGGPNGGDGGKGGSIFLVATDTLSTLVDFSYQRQHIGPSGAAGTSRDCTGAQGADQRLPVPVGTRVYDVHANRLLKDLSTSGMQLCVARGGAGGLGNTRFKSSVNRAPRTSTPGELGEERLLRLELILMAEVGLLGLPNAGKSSLLSALTHATPKIADYPYTTLVPSLGVVRVAKGKSFVLADLPGLIEGASRGVGLGDRFLRHLSRCKILWHVIDICDGSVEQLVWHAKMLWEELNTFNRQLLERPRLMVFNKSDALPAEAAKKKATAVAKRLDWKQGIYLVSTQKRAGLSSLVNATWLKLGATGHTV